MATTFAVVAVLVVAVLVVLVLCVRMLAPRVHARIDPLGAELALHTAAMTKARVRRASRITAPRTPIAPDGTASGFTTLVVDTWRRQDFTLRARAVGLSWLPFVAPPEHHETADQAEKRLQRRYRLTGPEKETLASIAADDAGRIALAVAAVADAVLGDPAWSDAFFDQHGLRVDLAAEVSRAAETARSVHAGWSVLGDTPRGPRARDPDIVHTYIDQSRALDSRVAALSDRASALDDYRAGVSEVRDRIERRAWLDAARSIDDFEHSIDAVVDRHAADGLRASADESSFLASVHIDTLAPLAQSLTLKRRAGSPDLPPS